MFGNVKFSNDLLPKVSITKTIQQVVMKPATLTASETTKASVTLKRACTKIVEE